MDKIIKNIKILAFSPQISTLKGNAISNRS